MAHATAAQHSLLLVRRPLCVQGLSEKPQGSGSGRRWKHTLWVSLTERSRRTRTGHMQWLSKDPKSVQCWWKVHTAINGLIKPMSHSYC